MIPVTFRSSQIIRASLVVVLALAISFGQLNSVKAQNLGGLVNSLANGLGGGVGQIANSIPGVLNSLTSGPAAANILGKPKFNELSERPLSDGLSLTAGVLNGLASSGAAAAGLSGVSKTLSSAAAASSAIESSNSMSSALGGALGGALSGRHRFGLGSELAASSAASASASASSRSQFRNSASYNLAGAGGLAGLAGGLTGLAGGLTGLASGGLAGLASGGLSGLANGGLAGMNSADLATAGATAAAGTALASQYEHASGLARGARTIQAGIEAGSIASASQSAAAAASSSSAVNAATTLGAGFKAAADGTLGAMAAEGASLGASPVASLGASPIAGRSLLASEALGNAQAEAAIAGADMAAHGANNARSAALASNAYRQAKLASARDRVNVAGTVQNSARISDAAIATHDAATKAEDSLLGSELAVDSAATVLDSDAAYIPPVTSSLLRSLPYGRLGIRNIIPKPLTYPSVLLPDVWLNGAPVSYLNMPLRMLPYGVGSTAATNQLSTSGQAFANGFILNGQPFVSNNGIYINGMLVDPSLAYLMTNMGGVLGSSVYPILANGQVEAQDETAMAHLINLSERYGAGASGTYHGFGRLNSVPMLTGSVSNVNLGPTTTIGTTYPIGSALVIEPRDSFFQDYIDNASSRQNFDERQQ